jgi:hypothetical protein
MIPMLSQVRVTPERARRMSSAAVSALRAIIACGVGWLAASAAFARERQPPDTILPPAPAVSPTQMMTVMQLYHMATLVMWLTAGGFIAGLLVGAVTRKRAGVWAVAAVTAFLGAMMAVGADAAPGRAYVPLIVAGVLLVLCAAAFGGWIGERLWGGAQRPTTSGR